MGNRRVLSGMAREAILPRDPEREEERCPYGP